VTRDGRSIEIQRLFRSANERLSLRLASGAHGDGQLLPFLCECADDQCRSRIPLSGADYAGFQRDGEVFLVLDGHPSAEGRAVGQHDGFSVVSMRDASGS
jgi:hypothetical protein